MAGSAGSGAGSSSATAIRAGRSSLVRAPLVLAALLVAAGESKLGGVASFALSAANPWQQAASTIATHNAWRIAPPLSAWQSCYRYNRHRRYNPYRFQSAGGSKGLRKRYPGSCPFGWDCIDRMV